MTAANAAVENRTARGKRFVQEGYTEAVSFGNSAWATADRHLPGPDDGKKDTGTDLAEEGGKADATGGSRSEAELIYQAAVSGKPSPIDSIRKPSKVPYGHLAKDGVIEYNGVIFVCDEKTNSICLGDMTDEKNVLNISLSGGGHLKVNRNSIGLLSKASSMFSPEDLNLIMRAIAEDTKIQSVKKEIEDEEASVGNHLRSADEADAGESTEKEEPEG